MSYIRCLSNPEGLYIWSDGEHVSICHNVKAPLASTSGRSLESVMFAVPTAVFEHACLKWANYPEKTTYKGFTIEEVHVFVKTGERVPPTYDILRQKARTETLVRISYKKHFVHLWLVTWKYVVNNVERRERRPKPKRMASKSRRS